MTIRDAAQAAIDVQNACNLAGVVRMWREVMPTVFEAADSTGARNRHPVSICFASKVADLAGLTTIDLDVFGEAFHACQTIVDREAS